jgi:hypothetical protein
MTLEEWRHWLEGEEHPFLVWTDHKNLEYLRTDNCLNSRQARWALLFTGFNFTISYRPGSKNTKQDALSRLYSSAATASESETILPASCLAGAIVWGIEALVRKAQCSQPDPGEGPANQMFIPDSVQSQVLEWAHSSRLTCHPGACRTLAFLRQRFWWPTVAPDVSAFVAACMVCAQNKTPRQAPSGLLQPLPVPHRLWSLSSLDFVTGLPPSDGNTTMLMVVDRFSKSAHFIPLPKLPSTKEKAQLMMQHVFRIYGLPVNIVSDRGPQFLSRFWKAFCTLIGLSTSLFPGFHPQSNGQSERANQDMETALRCLVTSNPTTWSQQLVWVEYAKNTLPCLVT